MRDGVHDMWLVDIFGLVKSTLLLFVPIAGPLALFGALAASAISSMLITIFEELLMEHYCP